MGAAYLPRRFRDTLARAGAKLGQLEPLRDQHADFHVALALIDRAGVVAAALNHHPESTGLCHRLAVRLTTHDAGNRVTAKDVELARRHGRFLPPRGR